MEERNFYLYIHLRLTDDSIFYVGKGCRYRSTSKDGRNPHWHNIVNKHGFIAQIVQRDMTCDEANEAEIQLIYKLRNQGVKLCNRTDGGEGAKGFKHSEEAKAKMRELRLGKKDSEETRLKKIRGLTGRKVSQKSIETLIERNKTMILSEESKKHLSDIRKGKNTGPRSEETKRRMSEGKKRGWAAKKQAAIEISAIKQKEHHAI